MDPVRNPYSPGAGTPPPALVGREAQISEFNIALNRLNQGRPAKSILMHGLRGVGKTVLLSEFVNIAEDLGWAVQTIEASDNMDFPSVIGDAARKAGLSVSASRRMGDRFERVMGAIKSFSVTWDVHGGGSLEVKPFMGLGDSGDLETDLSDIMVELGRLAQDRKKGILFAIDELQYLSSNDLSALIQAFHKVSQKQVPVMIVAAGLPTLLGILGEARSYAERLFSFTAIGNLTVEDASDAITKPALDEGVRWSADAVQLVVGQTEGYPYFLQEFGKQTWDYAPAEDVITQDDAQQAIPLAMTELDNGFFQVRVDRISDSEKKYIKAMASLGSGPYASGDVAKALKKKTSQLGTVRDSLIKKGLCYAPEWGQIDFTVPMFNDFVQRAM